MSEMRRVTAIRNGTVVDHIPSGNAMQVIRILRIDTDRATPVSLVMNVPSDKLGRKDVLKIEDRELDQEDLESLRDFQLEDQDLEFHLRPFQLELSWDWSAEAAESSGLFFH